jgi:tight adherence protein C
VLLLLLLGLALTAVAVAMLARLLVVDRPPPGRALSQIDAYGYEARAVASDGASRPLTSRVDALAAKVGDFVTSRMKSFQEDGLRKELQAAGLYTMSARKFMGYRLLATLALPALWLWFASTTGAGVLRVVVGLTFALAFGWQGPMIVVRRRSRKRLEAIDAEMPELIDLLVTTVEAGIAFSGSLRLAATRFHGALGEELRLAIQEQEMGLSANEALMNMLARADTAAMRSFVRSILQGETLGVSIGKIMRDLALEMRKRRRQLAEERVQKAPTKMIFPLVFLIFPGMFVVLLGPAALQILETIGGGK